MNLKNGLPPPDDLPVELEAELGEIAYAEQVCPGVYYLAAKREEEFMMREYYAVLQNSIIFQAVKKYGRAGPDLRVFSMQEDASGWRIVDYEVCKYLVKTRKSLPPGKDLHTIAFFAAEYHPEYFGTYPVPLHTPRGYTIRTRTFDNGVFWIETSQGEEVLAVCYPIWDSELSNAAKDLGKQTEYDQAHGIDKTLGYLFFPKNRSCIPLYELLQLRPEWEGKLIDKVALMNAIWNLFPEYALVMNRLEQQMTNQWLSQLLDDFPIEQKSSLNHVIRIFPDASDKFLLF